MVKIEIHNSKCKVVCDDEETLDFISDVLSYHVDGSEFAGNPYWDGRKRLFKSRDNSFPTGLLPRLERQLTKNSIHYTLKDVRVRPTIGPGRFPIKIALEPRDYQEDFVPVAIEAERGVALVGTGGGKCQHGDTPILMFDGQIKKARHVVKGDELMGPDSGPRKVLSVTSGRDTMYRITPIKGDSHVFNSEHVLSLRASANYRQFKKGQVVDVSIQEYLKWNNKMKHIFKWHRVGIDWPNKDVFEPYLVGLWLGDRSRHSRCITSGDKEIQDYLRPMASRIEKGDNHETFFFQFKVNKNFKKCIDGAKKIIPKEYLINSRAVRLELLAGLLDTDGHLHHNFYEITTKDMEEEILFLARSLGFAAYTSKKMVKLKSWDSPREYSRITISGDVDEIPLRVIRKKASPRKQKKNVLNTGFSITKLPEDDYFGWEIDGDRRYVLGDFSVTHNTIMSGMLISALGLDTLVVVPDVGLREQLYSTYVALFGSHMVGKTVQSGKPIVVTNIQATAKLVAKDFSRFKVLIIDEFHHAAAATYQRLNHNCQEAYFRYGLTGTFTRSSGDTMELHGVLSKVIFRKTTSELIEDGWLVRPVVTFHRYQLPKRRLNYKMSYDMAITDVLLNRGIASIAELKIADHKQTLVLVRRKEHGRLLQSMIKGSVFLSGDDALEYREQIKKAFLKKELPCIIATNIFGEGTDIPSIDVLVNARFEKTEIQTKQGVGRALRLCDGKDSAEIHDFLLMGNKHLQSHSLERLNTCTTEPAFRIKAKKLVV